MKWGIRIGIGIAILFAIGFLALQMLRVPLAERAFENAVNQNLAADRSAELPDGLHVYLCGSGSPFPSSRAGPCVGVLAGDTAFLFDVGSGGIRNLMQMGFPIEKLETTYLTHLHSDHIDSLGELLLQAWIVGGRSEPLPIAGPVGTDRVVSAFTEAYVIDRGYRIAHHGTEVANPDGFGGVAIEISLPVGPGSSEVVYDSGDSKITAILVDHAPIEPAFAYRIDSFHVTEW